jgi:hypothetical protein
VSKAKAIALRAAGADAVGHVAKFLAASKTLLSIGSQIPAWVADGRAMRFSNVHPAHPAVDLRGCVDDRPQKSQSVDNSTPKEFPQ